MFYLQALSASWPRWCSSSSLRTCPSRWANPLWTHSLSLVLVQQLKALSDFDQVVISLPLTTLTQQPRISWRSLIGYNAVPPNAASDWQYFKFFLLTNQLNADMLSAQCRKPLFYKILPTSCGSKEAILRLILNSFVVFNNYCMMWYCQQG